MHDQPTTCTDCSASALTLFWGDDLEICAPCYNARLLEVEKGNAVAAAREVIRWHNWRLDGHAVPPMGIGGRWI